MAWSTPRTWTADEVVTAAIMNSHLRDNLNVLKVTRDDVGRISELSSTTLADLSAANVTGLARPAAANAFTAGRTRFLEAARCVLPVGADKYEDLGGGLRRGIWVEGDYLHHIASDQTTEYRYLGAHVSTPAGAVAGSCWIEGQSLHYVDADGDERRCDSAGAASVHDDTGATPGSWWVETYHHWIQEAGSLERPGHADIVHADGTDHSDTHSDVAHSDSHSDVGHADSHADSHTDTAHVDLAHADHYDLSDFPKHEDLAHEDNAHADSHSDTHTDVAHVDAHADSHTDTHQDHEDHDDAAHQDQPTVVA